MSVFSHFLLWKIGLSQAETQTSQSERDCLTEFVVGCSKVAEIGVWHGVSTCALRKGMSPSGVLFAVDPYFPGHLGFSF